MRILQYLVIVGLLLTGGCASATDFVASEHQDSFYNHFEGSWVLITLDKEVIQSYGGSVTIPNIKIVAGYYPYWWDDSKKIIVERSRMSDVTLTEECNFFAVYIPKEVIRAWDSEHGMFVNFYSNGKYFADP